MMRGPTNSATRAAAAEAHADHAEAALAVCLQQPSFRGPDVRVVIRLLAVSKRLAALVARFCAGALALHTRVDKHADALAAWLSHHGALLADLELEMVLPCSWQDQAATLLPALATLSQLTSLVMRAPGDDLSQLPVQHMPAQLQQLELLGGIQCATAALPWLALEHVTGLTRLSMPRARVDGGVLPCGLRSLAVASVSSVTPLQSLEQLTTLQLHSCNSDTTSAGQLRQLSTLRRLEQLSVRTLGAYQADLSTTLAALAVLPLTHLNVINPNLTAASLARLGDCTRLTSLELLSIHLADGATPAQLAAAVARLTALERVQLLDEAWATADAAGCWAPVGKVLARLARLAFCHIELPGLGAAAAHLAAATQLTELHVLAAGCGFDDGCVATLCSGLTGLQHLDVSANRLLTDGCLACVAAMPRLMLLDVRYTGVTDDGVQQLCAARPSLQVQRR